ncbi:hypothetical protein FACS189472_15910 [Alphaproteobacteria bacterium]|nr:hypothetical protein FACS189472_15910 [Alphaproteobacteria bacterium]
MEVIEMERERQREDRRKLDEAREKEIKEREERGEKEIEALRNMLREERRKKEESEREREQNEREREEGRGREKEKIPKRKVYKRKISEDFRLNAPAEYDWTKYEEDDDYEEDNKWANYGNYRERVGGKARIEKKYFPIDQGVSIKDKCATRGGRRYSLSYFR